MLPADPDTSQDDLEQLIRGGPFELSLAADRLGSNLFGIHSDPQVLLPTCSLHAVSFNLSLFCYKDAEVLTPGQTV